MIIFFPLMYISLKFSCLLCMRLFLYIEFVSWPSLSVAVDVGEIKVQVILQPFDLLYLNGVSYLKEPFSKRRETLYSNFKQVEGKFVFAESMEGTEVDEIQSFLDKSIKAGCEGKFPTKRV